MPVASRARPSLGCQVAIDVVERAYQLDDVSDQTWLEQLAEAAAPELNRGAGVIAYMASADTMVSRVVGTSRVTAALATTMQRLNDFAPAPVREDLRSLPRGCYSIHDAYRGSALLDYWAVELTPRGVADAIGLSASVGPDVVNVFAPSGTVEDIAPRVKEMWSRIGVHLAAAGRLRRSLRAVDVERSADAIVDVSGDVKHAVGEAEGGGARTALRNAVRAIESARGPLRERDPEAALALWSGLVQGRWSLVDYWDRDGRRFFAAHPNPPGVLDPRRLRAREASALTMAIDGASQKEIAYALGIAPGNARALVSKALRKLGLESRAALYRLSLDRGGVFELPLEGDTTLHILVSARRQSGMPVEELLTDAELEVARLAAAGRSNAQIAEARKSAARTVANQMAAILRKLGLRSRIELGAHLPVSAS